MCKTGNESECRSGCVMQVQIWDENEGVEAHWGVPLPAARGQRLKLLLARAARKIRVYGEVSWSTSGTLLGALLRGGN